MSEEARKAEAKNESVAEIEFRGHKFNISREYDDWTVDFTESLEEGKSVGIVRGALGPSQWPTIRRMDLTNKDLIPLVNAITQALGFSSAGESPASSDS